MSYSVFSEVLFLIILSSVFIYTSAKSAGSDTKKLFRAFWGIAFVIYAGILFWAALMSRHEGYNCSLDLNPFKFYRFVLIQYNSFDVFKQLADNILVFVPFGLLFPAMINAKYEKKSFAAVIFAGFAASLIIETLQYVFAIGFSEVDDIINNTWGCAIGCGLYALTGKIQLSENGVLLKKGWFRCLLPLISFMAVFGVIWYYREFILCFKQ